MLWTLLGLLGCDAPPQPQMPLQLSKRHCSLQHASKPPLNGWR